MELIEIKKQIKALQAKKLKIEKLMRKPDGKMLNVAWLHTVADINELQDLLNNTEGVNHD